MPTLELSDREADVVSDVLSMWIEGIDEEVPTLACSDAEAHWSLYELRRQKELIGRIRIRLALERGDPIGI